MPTIVGKGVAMSIMVMAMALPERNNSTGRRKPVHVLELYSSTVIEYRINNSYLSYTAVPVSWNFYMENVHANQKKKERGIFSFVFDGDLHSFLPKHSVGSSRQ